jgi:hypothetical protein
MHVFTAFYTLKNSSSDFFACKKSVFKRFRKSASTAGAVLAASLAIACARRDRAYASAQASVGEQIAERAVAEYSF